jgi:hypothetical protein
VKVKIKTMLRKALNLAVLAIVLSSCSGLTDQFKNKTWEGQVIRANDQKELSDVRLKFTNDTLYIYSNAIFGADNDTLLIQSVNNKDSSLVVKNTDGIISTIYFNFKTTTHKETLYIYGTDYYIALVKSSIEIGQPDAISFYKNRSVPRDAYMYLYGTYEGRMQMEGQMQNIVLAQMGGIGMKLVFLEDFKVKSYTKSFFLEMFGGGAAKPTIFSYHIIQ